jgi:hypothetical protein
MKCMYCDGECSQHTKKFVTSNGLRKLLKRKGIKQSRVDTTEVLLVRAGLDPKLAKVKTTYDQCNECGLIQF